MKRILIVDDDPLVRKFLVEDLRQLEYEVFTAENGAAALKLLPKLKPKILLIDLSMPVMGGIELLEELVPLEKNNFVVIVLTGYGSDEDIETCYELGVQSFLRKPVNLSELHGLLQYSFQKIEYAERLQEEIREKEKVNSLLKNIFESMGEGVITLDDHFQVQMASKRACESLKLEETQLLGKSAANLLGSEVGGPEGILMQCVKSGKSIMEVPTRLFAPSGIVLPVSLSVMLLQSPHSKQGYLLIFKDIRQEEKVLMEKNKGVDFGNMISSDPKMKEIFEIIENVASSTATVLIQGESGTGKELVAQEIHARGSRAQKPFHAVNCAAISPNLLESEFFGHEKGSFTGAIQQKAGRFELANTGTLFLDEIGEIPLELQVKLLRVLQEQKFERVGGTKSISVDVRIIAATNQHLDEMVKNKRFREDLFYRLDVISINLPPLKERLQDVPLLVSSFIRELNQKEGKDVRTLAKETLQILINYNWPGNIRELYHVIEYAFTFCKGKTLQPKHLPKKLFNNQQDSSTHSSAPRDEREAILKALEQTNYHKGRAAALLGVSPVTLYRKRKKFEI